MGLRSSIFGRPENPVQKAAVEAVSEAVGYPAAKFLPTNGDQVEIKDGAVLVRSVDGLSAKGGSVGHKQHVVEEKLEAAGLVVEDRGVTGDTVDTGIRAGIIAVPAEQNGGFSGIADKINAYLGKSAAGADKSHVAEQEARRAASADKGGPQIG